MGGGLANGAFESMYAADGAICERRLRTTRNRIKPPMSAMTASPPTTPPTMAPMLVFLEPLSLLAETGVVGELPKVKVVGVRARLLALDDVDEEVVKVGVEAVDSGDPTSSSAARGL